MSFFMRSRIVESLSLSINFASPPSCAHGGTNAESELFHAVYAYVLAVMSRPDARGFFQSVHYRVALAAHVRGIDAAVVRGLRCESDQFWCLGVRRRRILQRSGDPHCAFTHGLSH